MPRKKKSFLLYYEWESIFDGLTDAQLGALLRVIYAYEVRSEEYDGADVAIRMAFGFIRPALDRNKARYERVCERNRRNIQSRWADTKNTSGTSGIPDVPDDTKNTDYDYEYDSDYDYDRDYDREGDRDARARGRYRPPTTEAVRAYVRDNGLRVDVERYMDYYRARNWRTANGKPVDWQARLRQWDDGPAEQPDKTTEERAAENRQYLEQAKALLRRMREEDTQEDDHGQAD